MTWECRYRLEPLYLACRQSYIISAQSIFGDSRSNFSTSSPISAEIWQCPRDEAGLQLGCLNSNQKGAATKGAGQKVLTATKLHSFAAAVGLIVLWRSSAGVNESFSFGVLSTARPAYHRPSDQVWRAAIHGTGVKQECCAPLCRLSVRPNQFSSRDSSSNCNKINARVA